DLYLNSIESLVFHLVNAAWELYAFRDGIVRLFHQICLQSSNCAVCPKIFAWRLLELLINLKAALANHRSIAKTINPKTILPPRAIKAIKQIFNEEDIVIPYPIRTLYSFDQEKYDDYLPRSTSNDE
ncbi:MAG: hypothetical protein QNJ53_23240, partial [Pleurocapsa sp. MO_192.B19]|nr:hypothetical protein [Pleurocapsa sp. MO_192.B19]